MNMLADVYTKDGGTIHCGAPVDFAKPREPRPAFGLLLDEDKLNQQAQAILDHISLRRDPRTNVGGLTVVKPPVAEISKPLSFNARAHSERADAGDAITAQPRGPPTLDRL